MRRLLTAITLTALTAIVSVPSFSANAVADSETLRSLDQPFDQYSWLTTHNAFTSNGIIPNQNHTVAQQLENGVRAFMLDLHTYVGRVALCHRTCSHDSSTQTFASLMNDTVLPFLDTHPDAILTLHLEDFTTRAQLADELGRVPALAGITFDPASWPDTNWPTYRQMLERGQRLLIFSLNDAGVGAIPVGEGAVHIMASSRYTVENYWSLGKTILSHDKSCVSRWGERTSPLSRSTVPGKPGWRPLFTMNHFHGVPISYHAASDNAFHDLQQRYLTRCLPAAKRKPNYVAVDFYERGEAGRFVEWLNWQPISGSH